MLTSIRKEEVGYMTKPKFVEVTIENEKEIFADSWQLDILADFYPERIVEKECHEDFTDVEIEGTLVDMVDEHQYVKKKATMTLRIAESPRVLQKVDHMFKDGKVAEVLAVDEEEEGETIRIT